MESRMLVESFTEFAKQKNIDRPTMIRILEDVIRSMIRKKFINDENFDIIINVEKGDFEIWRSRQIVDDNSEDIWDTDKITLTDARKIEPDFEEGEEVSEEIKLEDFGRRAILTARQTLIQRIKDMEKDMIFAAYKDRIGEMVTGEIYQITQREMLLADTEGHELVMPRGEQIPKDRFRKGDTIRAVIHRVDMNNAAPRIIVSRASGAFLERLFEQEVPEIMDNLIAVRKAVREPGERAKVAVESFDDRIDPVGACVGMKGSRIHAIVRELQNENIDVINYTDNMELYIARALNPAKISTMKVDEENRRVSVFLRQDQVSLAIGKGGQNIKLASRLVDMEIEVYRELEGEELEDDIAIEEFDDEIEAWVLDEFRRIGLDTARRILATPIEDLIRRTDLEESTIEDVVEILKREFDHSQEEATEAETPTDEGSDEVSIQEEEQARPE
jgi:transcription termination/antitermination protein NusA